ncbi:MobA/MobL family protein [Lactonifactor longoviformis]|uniref:MobA/MobL family protein n=1 Tax=Lactonifactor longoviformis TaxID=341220 RepID=UPI0036F43A5B
MYATYQTADVEFWKNLAKENQQEFIKSGTEGKCIEARELIIALPENYTKYNPQQVLETFTEAFKNRYYIECVSALHHNKRKTNYHIHLIFSERQLLPEPENKIASRNMFYDEQGKHIRTKKEILDIEGKVREGCKIIPKGSVYDSRIFTNKNQYFKSDEFLAEEKKNFTELINQYIDNPKERLQVFDRNSVYLPTKKIGKHNPKAAEIDKDNQTRQEWNFTVDEALIAGVEEKEIRKVKKQEITAQVSKSIADNGRKPGMFHIFIEQATKHLKTVIEKWRLPSKPVLKVDMIEFRKMQYTKEKLEKQIAAIRNLEQYEIPHLKEELEEVKGLFRGKERKSLESRIANAQERLSSMKTYLNTIVNNSGYKSVQGFMRVYKKAEGEVLAYQKAMEQYRTRGGQKPLEEESIREQLRRLTEEGKRSEIDRKVKVKKEKGVR